MSADQIGIVVFFSIAIATSLACHWFIRRYLIATLLAATAAVCAFQLVVYLDIGYLDPFFLVAMCTTGAAGLATSAILGMPFLYARRRRAAKRIE